MLNEMLGEMLSKKFKWVITGGAGFIGSHLVKALLEAGQQVAVVDNTKSIKESAIYPLLSQIEFINGDIRSFDTLSKAFNKADYIVHYAALVSVAESMEKPLETFEINTQGTANVLEAARQNKVKRVVFASSSAVYGNNPNPPYTEDTPLDPQSPYAQSKHLATELCQTYTKIYGLETAILRYFNVYGPGQNANSPYSAAIAKFMTAAAQNKPFTIDWDGKQSRDFIYVSDIVAATLLVAFKGEAGGVYNAASGRTHTLLELTSAINKLSGLKLPPIFRPKRAGDVKTSSADTTKLQALGFKPRFSLEEGLSAMWQIIKKA
ncbi:MAG: SDR family NAD(P)-dependent oxidoreductase [Elusimicrobiota bacterium]|jgi:nucleoside-diphosphate-sugar epimerase|nr:SDR family NAD(P)-dependent oxidoreductase [Elusimicrobiota bacterium]